MTLAKTHYTDIRKVLDARHTSLLEEVRAEMERSENQHYIELIGHSDVDSGDAVIGDVLGDVNFEYIDRHVQQLREIEAARNRLGEGSFGVCADCGEDIAFGRLLATPVVLRCYDCQQQCERIHARSVAPGM